MRVVVFGTGLIGSQVTARLAATGHDVIGLDRRSGVDTETGKGVAKAVVGADVVLDATNTRAWSEDEVMAFFQKSTAHLLDAERDAGVGHHIALSIVGADRMPDSGYLRAKHVQERLVSAHDVPYTIVRSTQFFEFLGTIADAATFDGVVHASPAALQPIASADAALRLTEVVLGAPVGGPVEIAGPDRLGLDALLQRLLSAHDDPRRVETDATAGYFGASLTDTSLIPEADAWLGQTTFDRWLAGRDGLPPGEPGLH